MPVEVPKLVGMTHLKSYISIFILLACFSGAQISAQVTAVMDVKVTIISGASLTQQNELNLFLHQNDTSASKSENLFQLTTAKHTEVNLDLPELVQVTNEFGETATIRTNCSSIENKDLGTHIIEMKSSLADSQPVRGRYFGVFTTTIDYL